MGLFTKDIKTMDDLFVHQLQDIYYAERQLVKALPKMAEKATDKVLKQGFLTHLDETRTHVQRLEEVFRMHGAEALIDAHELDGGRRFAQGAGLGAKRGRANAVKREPGKGRPPSDEALGSNVPFPITKIIRGRRCPTCSRAP